MDYIFEYGLFLAQAATIVAAILIVVGGVIAMGMRQKPDQEGHIEIKHLNEKYEYIKDSIEHVVCDQATLKNEAKQKKKLKKKESKDTKKKLKASPDGRMEDEKARVYVLGFDGDIKASAVDNLREEISAVLPQIREGDEIVLKLESPGGMVHSYGLAASQLKRITDASVPLTVAVDKVAASGGYMMACVANKIIAAPVCL